MNPVSRFIYWNMNYHVEHHMFPMVPYHALPKLHELIKDDLPAPNARSLRPIARSCRRSCGSSRSEDYFVRRELPPTAKPYKAELHGRRAFDAGRPESIAGLISGEERQ